MKEFSKKTDLILLIISLLAAILGCIIIAMSGNLLYIIQDFLETKIFHRTFKIEKWADTINALMTFPIFIVIFFDTIFFAKFLTKSKVILIGFYFAATLFFIVFCSIMKPDEFMTSDMASDILLAKECWANKTFWPLSWHYSTEFRLLNTQLFAAPLFAFTSNWHIVKIISSFFICLLLPLSLWFLLTQLQIKSLWAKLVSCILILCPWSILSYEFMQFGNYYIPHVAMSFFYIGFCISLIFNDNSQKKEKAFKIIFYILSFICGLSSIRYLLQFQIPLLLVVIAIALTKVTNGEHFTIKSFFINNKKVFYPLIGFVIGCVGYIINTLILSRLYSFSDFNTMKFNDFNSIPIMRWLYDIFACLGYKNQVSVFTPSGIINVLVYIFIAFAFLCIIEYFRKKTTDEKKTVFFLYTITMFVFNGFVFINTDYYARYILILVLCAFPCIPVLVESTEISIIKRTVLGLVCVIMLSTSSFVTYSTALSSNGNFDKKEVTKFLKEKNYTFGYATFRNANVISFFTDGKIEILPVDYPNRQWLTTKRYNKSDYKSNEKVFLLLENAETKKFPEVFECEKAKKIYEDDFYTVLGFESNSIFRSEWGRDHLYRISLQDYMLE